MTSNRFLSGDPGVDPPHKDVAARRWWAAGLAVLAGYGFGRKRRVEWVRERDALVVERDALARERDELARERDAAQTANIAKSRYLSTVSHEIRSPLNAIYGYAQLMERNDGAGALEAAVVIRRCAEHITSLVEALLDISQVENGVIRVKPEQVRLDGFIDQILRMVRPAAAAKGLEFHYEASGRMPDVVRMDPSRLRQVLLNLLFNAVKYTDHGSVTLAVHYGAQIATFEVRDTGPGIAPGDREAIFEPYGRGSDDALRERPGAGLGLSIARAIVGFLGGQLELAESDGKGTVFRLTMMLGEVRAPAKTRQRREVSGYLGPRRSILLCDDEAEQRRVLSDLLGSIGFEVEAVPNGETAVAMVEGIGPEGIGGAGIGGSGIGGVGRRFDLAILDISLPGLSGWEVAERLRARLGEDIRILMLSANTQEFHHPATTTPVHDHFLVKPVEFSTLIETIGGLLDLAWGFEADGARPVPPPPAPTSLGPEAAIHATRIRELLRIGYVRGIEQEIRALAEAPDTGPLAQQLFACLDRFDLPGMARILEEC